MAEASKTAVLLGPVNPALRESDQAVHQLPTLLAHLSPEELKQIEKRLVRKTDIRLLPTMTLIYILNYLDRFYPP